MIRLKGQQKLCYIKESKLNNKSKEQIFLSYPHNKQIGINLKTYILTSNNQVNGNIIQNHDGIHLVQKKHQQLQGIAISIFNNGKLFQGYYHHGLPQGIGFEIIPNRNTYLGQFRNGLKHGIGFYYWYDTSQTYYGHWAGGLPHGQGKYVSQDTYQGQFSNGLKFGFGEEHFRNGDKYIGDYVNGISDGYGEYRWKDNSVYKGDFKFGVRHGYGYWNDGKESYKGSYKMDKKEGFGIYCWGQNTTYKGHFSQDFRDGYGELYENGRENATYKGMWSKGKSDSKLKIDKIQYEQFLSFMAEERRDILAVSPKKRQKISHRKCISQNLRKQWH